MTGDTLPVEILTLQLIANVSPDLARRLGLDSRHKSIGLLSTDCDDVTYMALDEATKKAAVDVVYARSLYAGAANASTVYLAHCVSRTGSYLSKVAKVPQGEAIAYLIAPPVEAMVALDAALKAADVRMTALFAPPSETNFAGGLLTGTQSACIAACDAFGEAVRAVAAAPQSYGG